MSEAAPASRRPRQAQSAVRRLADRLGILAGYLDNDRRHRATSDETRVALLGAMGFDASTEARAEEALARIRRDERSEIMAPVRVVERSDPSARTVEIRPPRRVGAGAWRLELLAESGDCHIAAGRWTRERTLRLALPVAPPLGYHEVRVRLDAGEREWTASQRLIVVPSRAMSPDGPLGDQGAFGIIANLYTLRSEHNWGVGDFSDLATLAEWAASEGADFVGVNPLHALVNRGDAVSPYSPVSRLFRNPIYLDVTAVPEVGQATALAARVDSPEMREELAALRATAHVRYDQVMAVKGLALDALHRVFADRERGSGSERARAYDAYVALHEPALTSFATWMAIAEDRARLAKGDDPLLAYDWRSWPPELQSPDSPAVRQFVEAHAERLSYHRWVQFELDRQLAAAADWARDTGMRIGLYQDLAIGSSPGGADTWAYGDLFVADATVGAPPDPLAPTGQNWGFPPADPRALRRDGYRYVVQLLRGALRHAGALRIDHILGLFRLFWIPRGQSGASGAYVRYPTSDLLGILALESIRHSALIVGEDLGTVPRQVPRTLARWGLLSSKVLMFERAAGGFKPASRYPRLALATANTHDTASITGFTLGRDIELRAQVGLVSDAASLDDARRDRDTELAALARLLVRSKMIKGPTLPDDPAALRGAVHAFLSSTPSALVGFALDDLTGEIDPVNIPGVESSRYHCWTRKMRVGLEEIPTSTAVRAALRGEARRSMGAP